MTFAPHTKKQENFFAPPPELTLPEAVFFLDYLVENLIFLNSQVLHLLEQAERAESWYVAHRRDARDGTSLQLFVWPPGSGTNVHDHSSWGAFCCAVGALLEERYERLDDGLQQNHARLKKSWQQVWRRGDGVSTVLPYEKGIHRVGNVGGNTAISVHLYGPPVGELDGRDYDPSRDYICDRWTTDDSSHTRERQG